MPKWEYLTIHIRQGNSTNQLDVERSDTSSRIPVDGKKPIDVLNELGEQEWEMVSCLDLPDSWQFAQNGQSVSAIFKKPKA